jgi:hypothetical protein
MREGADENLGQRRKSDRDVDLCPLEHQHG